MYKNLDNDQSELFLEPIPKWITHFGFTLIIFIFFLILVLSFKIKYPQSITIAVDINPDNSVVLKTDFSNYTFLKNHQKINIIYPFAQQQMEGTIDKNNSWGRGKYIYIPIELKSNRIIMKKNKYILSTKGIIKINDYTLIERIFINRKKE